MNDKVRRVSCDVCGTSFDSTHGRRFCSQDCRIISIRQHHRNYYERRRIQRRRLSRPLVNDGASLREAANAAAAAGLSYGQAVAKGVIK